MNTRSAHLQGQAGGRARFVATAVGVALALAFAVVVPIVLRPLYIILAANILVTALIGMSFNLLYGYAGMFSFGQAAFYGLGAYGTALLLNHTHVGFAPSLLLMVVLTAVAGLGLGVVLVGLERIAFVMLTFAAAELLGFAARRLVSITAGDSGLIVNVPASLNIVGNTKGVYYVVLGVSVVVVGLLGALVRSSFGLTLRAIKQNAVRVETVGIDVWRQKLLVFAIAAMVGGVAGSLSAITNQIVHPDVFVWLISANALIVTLLGSSGYFVGPIVGSVVLGVVGLYAGRITTNLVAVNGVIFLIIVLVAPQGITALVVQGVRRLRHNPKAATREPNSADPSVAELTGVQ